MLKGFVCAALLLFCLRSFAQPGIKDSIFSKVLNEERRFQIQIPSEYKDGSGTKYQVLYLLDGEWNAELFQQVQAWSRQWGYTPPIIMVGVVNSYPNNQNQRFRDLTPTTAGQNGAGGGPKLLSFLKDELIPYINSKYPSSGANILWGHSLGGLFVLYALFTEPQLFDSYISADPSVWWDNKWVIPYAKGRMGSIKQIKSLYITGRTGTPYHGMGIDSLEMMLEANAPPMLEWKAVAYPNETHIAVQYKSAYDGLKYTLAPLFMLDRIHTDPMGGTIVKGEPFNITCYNFLPEKYMRFSVDGLEPTAASAKVQPENAIKPEGDVSVKMKVFLPGDSVDKQLAMTFRSGKPVRPVVRPAQAVSGGFSYGCYRTAADAQAYKTGVFSGNMNLNDLDSNDYFCRLSGWVETAKKGYYIFEMSGPPGTRFFLGDKVLMEIEAGKDYNSYIVPLQSGFYSIRFEYTHQKKGKDFDFSYQPPGEPGDIAIPVSAMYHVP